MSASRALYLDTSAILRAALETGTTPAVEQAIEAADVLITSRLSLVEAARALLRLRHFEHASERQLADVGGKLDALWTRCQIWELTPSVCDSASTIAPAHALRTLEALHLATYLLVRRRISELELLTVDHRLESAAGRV